ncbi:MAG: DUF2752 domain-containing protein [Leptospiraceae bacterium]|nr:DUF2752 domain-containing protein [Leptospiraceae bacterium]MCK6380576.1 DUF2752 domain-containing protein [Leptospiraceae bacterium]NUM40343.1 DUF2752 domain-containing protein [Leptospiraceae bacterium]
MNLKTTIHSLTKEKLILASFTLAGIYLLIQSITTSGSNYHNHFTVCLFKNLTGLDCPGCGLSRSFIFLLQGNISISLSYHKLGIPVFFSFAFFYIHTMIRLLLKKDFFQFHFLKNNFFYFLVLLVVFTVYIHKLYTMGTVQILADLKTGIGWTILKYIFQF